MGSKRNAGKVFNAAAASSSDPFSVEGVITHIIQMRPDLADATFYVPSHGLTALTVMTENEVFKMGKSVSYLPYMQKEVQVLQSMQGKGFPVPQVTCQGENIFGMTRMQGVVLAEMPGDNL